MPTIEKETVPVATLPSGDRLTISILTVRGGPGKKVFIQANNHGGEIAGNLAILELLRILHDSDLNGTIVMVPHVNPVSLAQVGAGSGQGVFHDATGVNFNRNFKLGVRSSRMQTGEAWGVDLEAFVREHLESPWDAIQTSFRVALRGAFERFQASKGDRGITWRDSFAIALQSHSFDADLFLDLHTGDEAPRYLYAFRSELKSARYLNSPHTLAMEDDKFGGAADEAHWVPWAQLRDAFREQGREVPVGVESYTVELGCLETVDFDDARSDAANLANYLRYHGVISGTAGEKAMRRVSCHMDDYLLHCSPASGLAVWKKRPGDDVVAGETIAEVWRVRDVESFEGLDDVMTPVRASKDGTLVTRHKSPVVFEGAELFKLMTNVTREG